MHCASPAPRSSLRLSHRTAERLPAALARGRRPGLLRALVAEELFRRLSRRHDLERALAKSMNTIAVKLSLGGTRKGVGEPQEDGHRGPPRKLLDGAWRYRHTPLMHTAGYAHFANGGKRVHPMRSPKSALRAARSSMTVSATSPSLNRSSSARQSRRSIGCSATVVTAGTGGRARLEFTHVAGKTGTSSSYRDAWFMGFTGKYVTGVWFGNDSYRPMGRVTGGNLPGNDLAEIHGKRRMPTMTFRPYPDSIRIRCRSRPASARPSVKSRTPRWGATADNAQHAGATRTHAGKPDRDVRRNRGDTAPETAKPELKRTPDIRPSRRRGLTQRWPALACSLAQP